MSECPSCERYFDTSHALHQHNVSKHSTTYCPPCRRFFCSRSAKQQHIKDSAQHNDNICHLCPHNPDFDTESELDEHLAEKHVYCSTCDCGFDSQSQLAQHDVSVHNMCKDCPGRYFNSVSNLKNHRKTHAPKTIKCYGCDRKFAARSAMVLHLEAGTCESGINNDLVVEIALDCYQSQHYTNNDNDDFDFKCPTCDTPFVYMSGVWQHVESDFCEEVIEGPLGKFLRYLQTRI